MPNSHAHLIFILFERATDRKLFCELVSNQNYLQVFFKSSFEI